MGSKNYWLISLLCVHFKILKRLIYTGVEPIIDPLLPKEQAGFWCGKSTVDQVVLLTQNMEESFVAKEKAHFDLIAAYDTVWHRGLTCKLLRLLLDKNMLTMIMKLVWNQSITLTTGDSKQSKLLRRKNGVPQVSALAAFLLTSTCTTCPQQFPEIFLYRKPSAVALFSPNWKDLKETFSQDMTTFWAYLRTWRLMLSFTVMLTAAFYLNN